jgi:hypothetical protein
MTEDIVVPDWALEVTPSQFWLRDIVRDLLGRTDCTQSTIRGMALLVYHRLLDGSITPIESVQLQDWAKNLSDDQIETIEVYGEVFVEHLGRLTDQILGLDGWDKPTDAEWEALASELCEYRYDLFAIQHLLYEARGHGRTHLCLGFDGWMKGQQSLLERLRKQPRTPRRLDPRREPSDWWMVDM